MSKKVRDLLIFFSILFVLTFLVRLCVHPSANRYAAEQGFSVPPGEEEGIVVFRDTGLFDPKEILPVVVLFTNVVFVICILGMVVCLSAMVLKKRKGRTKEELGPREVNRAFWANMEVSLSPVLLRCPKCGYQSDGNFCPNCGSQMRVVRIGKEEPNRNPIIVAGIITVLLFGFLILATPRLDRVSEKSRSRVGLSSKPLFHQETPQEVIKKFLESLVRGDVATAETYFTQEYKAQSGLFGARMVEWAWLRSPDGLNLAGGGLYKYEIITSQISGNTARVSAATYRKIRIIPSNFSPPEQGRIETKITRWQAVLYKTDNGWKIGANPELIGKSEYLKEE